MSGFVFHPGALAGLTETVKEHYDAGRLRQFELSDIVKTGSENRHASEATEETIVG
jgi:hypothetical protein